MMMQLYRVQLYAVQFYTVRFILCLFLASAHADAIDNTDYYTLGATLHKVEYNWHFISMDHSIDSFPPGLNISFDAGAALTRLHSWMNVQLTLQDDADEVAIPITSPDFNVTILRVVDSYTQELDFELNKKINWIVYARVQNITTSLRIDYLQTIACPRVAFNGYSIKFWQPVMMYPMPYFTFRIHNSIHRAIITEQYRVINSVRDNYTIITSSSHLSFEIFIVLNETGLDNVYKSHTYCNDLITAANTKRRNIWIGVGLPLAIVVICCVVRQVLRK